MRNPDIRIETPKRHRAGDFSPARYKIALTGPNNVLKSARSC